MKTLMIIIIIILLVVSGVSIHNYYQISKLSSQNESKKEITQEITEREIINEIYLSLTEKNIKASEAIFSSIKWFYTIVGGLIALIIGSFTFFGAKYWFPASLKNAFDTQIKEWIKKSEKIIDLENRIITACDDVNIALTWTYNLRGVQSYTEYFNSNKKYKEILKRAIRHTEYALQFADKTEKINKESPEPELQRLWGALRMNLAYYYAEGKINYDEALKYIEGARPIAERYSSLDLIDNYIFVVVTFGVQEPKIIENAHRLFRDWGQEINEKIFSNEIDKKVFKNYEQFFRKKD